MKRAGGRRFYRPQDIVLLRAVKRLLHEEGLTIKGVQRLHKEQGLKKLIGAEAAALIDDGDVTISAATYDVTRAETSNLHQVLADLEQAKARLDAVLSR